MIVQIEDAEAVDVVEDIAAVPGVDALFIGRADLAVAYGTGDPFARQVDDAAGRIADAARANGIAVAGFHADAASFDSARPGSASMLVLGSDQSMLKAAWSAAFKAVRGRARREPA